LNDIIKTYKVLGLVTKDIDINSFVYEYNHPTEIAFTLNYDEIFHISIISLLAIVVLSFGTLFIGFRKRWLLTKTYLKEQIENQKEEIDKQNRIIIVQSKIVAIGEMLSNIAHQWRQPLNIISLNTVKIETSILLGKTMKNEELRQISEEINLQSQYLSQTIDDFRNYFNSNIENHALFNLKDAIRKVNELSKDVFKNNHIEIIISTEDCQVVQNESLLIQALLNICNNAKDAIVENSSMKKYFFIDAQCEKNSVVITLKDSGGGISKDVIEKIFEPYYTTKHQSKGTGLGLYITYGIITEHFHGTITVENVSYDYMDFKLSGAKFVITIPTKL
jgi:signal transduction histidine kinase